MVASAVITCRLSVPPYVCHKSVIYWYG